MKQQRQIPIVVIFLTLFFLVLPASAQATTESQAGFLDDATLTTVNITTTEAKPLLVSTEPYLSLEPLQNEIFPGDMVVVDVIINDALDIYGLQVDCTVDPTVLSWQTTEIGDFFTDPLVGMTTGDTSAGTWVTAVTQKNPAPALSGNGHFATFTFQAVAPGTTDITCEPLASDRDGFELPISALSTSVTVSGLLVTIDGVINYQGRTDHSGIEVAVTDALSTSITATNALSTSTQTDSTGQFIISKVESGEHVIRADANLYLPSCTSITVDNAQVTASLLPLAGGDIDDDDEIRINDVALISSNLGLSDTTTPPMDTRADINADGQVNIQDLSMLGGNFGKAGCQTN